MGGPSHRATATVLSLLALLAGATTAAAQSPPARFTTRVLAHIPSPGYAALSLVAPDGTIYAGSFEDAAADIANSKVFAFAPDGRLLRTYDIAGEPHGVQVAAIDASGLLYLMVQSPPSVVTLNPATGQQKPYATFATLPQCSGAAPGAQCKNTLANDASEPDYAAWGPDGSMYVTDYQQALIWKVPPGGGAASVWLTSPLFDGVQFDTAGIALMPDRHTLMFDTAASSPVTGSAFSDGKLYTVPIEPNGSPGPLQQLWTSGPAQAPDGLALSQAGNVYLALVGPGANQVVEISPTGAQLAAFPSATDNAAMAVPYDEPSSVQFDGEDLIVTNLSYLEGDTSHQVLFDVYAGEPGASIYHPPAAAGAPPAIVGPVASAPMTLRVSPRHIPVHRRTRVVVRTATARGPLAGVRVRIAGHTVITGRRGRATVTLLPPARGLLRVLASRSGYVAALRHVRVVRRAT